MSDDAVLQEIARLQSAISRARTEPAQRGRGSFRGYGVSHRGRGASWSRGGGNRTLVLNQPLSGKATTPINAPATLNVKHQATAFAVASENQPPAASTSKEVVIDGVTFLSDPRGKKLIRKGTADVAPTAVATPPRASVGGQTFVRTKNGNLIALDLVTKRASDAKVKRMTSMIGATRPFPGGGRGNARRGPARPIRKVNELCRFFTTTGQCRSGLTCVYQHDPDKLAICPRLLRNKCNLGDACPLSHEANAHRMPHCVHFPNCKHGSDCRFPHVHVSPTAGVCKAFATLGYCEKGTACPERHVRECPEFSEKGTCETPGCRLPHIIRKKGESASIASAAAVSSATQIEYASDSDDDYFIGQPANLKRKASDDSDVESSLLPSLSVPVKKRKQHLRLHDCVAEQADFLTFDESFDQDQVESVEADDTDDLPEGDVDSDVEGHSDA